MKNSHMKKNIFCTENLIRIFFLLQFSVLVLASVGYIPFARDDYLMLKQCDKASMGCGNQLQDSVDSRGVENLSSPSSVGCMIRYSAQTVAKSMDDLNLRSGYACFGNAHSRYAWLPTQLHGLSIFWIDDRLSL